ncbi:uncharacterized protein LOC112514756 [Cynara cardunculus var. scolymus]|uniref:uncharacterized protein LOC112514756 n=1 Tax=Cynara cardunculus var. scolymus TaxID=59895 RepID=UPI000D62C45F|nr:uncharacterized protein LOC112514756 [Cynara cardunculus var. scolymus]
MIFENSELFFFFLLLKSVGIFLFFKLLFRVKKRMEMQFSRSVMIFTFITLFLQQFTDSATLVVDGVSEWKNPTVQVGDSIIFRHKHSYNLYIFKNRRAFNLCNFTESTLLTPSTPTFTWHPSRLGSFYFAFKNSSTKACDDGQKLAIQVSSSTTPETSASPPVMAPSPSGGRGIVSSTPPPNDGGGDIVSSSPSYPWPNRPQELNSPSPSPMNAIFPRKGGNSLPFINSNPAVPLPTGEVDSATIRPSPTSSNHRLQGVGFVKAFCCVGLVVVLL